MGNTEYKIERQKDGQFHVVSEVVGKGWSGQSRIFRNFVALCDSKEAAEALIAKLRGLK